jgi:hypothetical protein
MNERKFDTVYNMSFLLSDHIGDKVTDSLSYERNINILIDNWDICRPFFLDGDAFYYRTSMTNPFLEKLFKLETRECLVELLDFLLTVESKTSSEIPLFDDFIFALMNSNLFIPHFNPPSDTWNNVVNERKKSFDFLIQYMTTKDISRRVLSNIFYCFQSLSFGSYVCTSTELLDFDFYPIERLMCSVSIDEYLGLFKELYQLTKSANMYNQSLIFERIFPFLYNSSNKETKKEMRRLYDDFMVGKCYLPVDIKIGVE